MRISCVGKVAWYNIQGHVITHVCCAPSLMHYRSWVTDWLYVSELLCTRAFLMPVLSLYRM